MSNKRPLTNSGETGPVQGPRNTTTKRVKFGDDDPVAAPGSKLGTTSSGRPSGDAKDDNFELEVDDVGGGAGKRRGAVRLDGYDSDSSAGSDGGAARRKGSKTTAGQDAGDEDDDMFASTAPKGEAVDEEKGPSKDFVDRGLDVRGGAKGKQFLDLGDIEGQEFGRGEGDEEGGGFSDEEEDFVPGDERANDDDAPRARRKSAKGMGFEISRFNMKNELEEGRFTADGSYVVEDVDPEAMHDNWLEGNTKRDMKRARQAQRRLQEEQRKREAAEDTTAMSRTRDDCLIAVLGLLLPNGETVSHALARLGAEKKRRARSRPNGGGTGKKTYARSAASALAEAEARDGGKDQMDVATAAESMDIDGVTDPVSARLDKGKAPAKEPKEEDDPLDRQIAQLTDLASTLTGLHGETDAYEFTHGTIVGMLKSEGAVRRDWVPPSAQSTTSPQPASAVEPAASMGAKKPLISRPTAASQGPRFQYRFKPSSTVSAAQAELVYGSFGKAEMEGWADGGYFGPQKDTIVVRKEGDDRWTSFAHAMA